MEPMEAVMTLKTVPGMQDRDIEVVRRIVETWEIGDDGALKKHGPLDSWEVRGRVGNKAFWESNGTLEQVVARVVRAWTVNGK